VSKPTRATPAGRAYLALQARARREGRPTDELLVLYVLERFLYRLSISEHRNRLVLKGGMLLAAFDERRPTGDVDLLARSIANDVDSISDIVRQILAVPAEDGVAFDGSALRASVIRDAELYSGVRIVVPATVDRARHPLRIDVNVGDPITPGPIVVDYPALIDEPFSLVGYPLASVLAEKIVTMIDRGDTTTRDRDFADVYLLARRHPIGAGELALAIGSTGAHRESDLRPIREVLVDLGTLRQADWSRFVERSGLSDAVPASLADVIDAVANFADPILTGEVVDGGWNPAARHWVPAPV
jgi:hypothetical protein